MQKFLAKIQEQEDLSKSIAITLPRMSFEMTGIQYDPTRKTGVTQTFRTCQMNLVMLKKFICQFHIILDLNLTFSQKLNDDALQIIEQILPFFQPSFNSNS